MRSIPVRMMITSAALRYLASSGTRRTNHAGIRHPTNPKIGLDTDVKYRIGMFKLTTPHASKIVNICTPRLSHAELISPVGKKR